MKIRYDSKTCTGCCACQMACLDQNDIRPDLGQNALCRIAPTECAGRLNYQFVHCVHCGSCVRACPSGCLQLSSDGLVLSDESRCIGCRACESACRLGVISFGPDKGTVIKCDGCIGRVQAGLLPACIHTCPTGALALETE